MKPLVKRIVFNGMITAVILGGLGYLFADLTVLWMASNTPGRASPLNAVPPATHPVGEALRTRLPFTMAAWGFGFIVVAELLLYVWRGNAKPQPAKSLIPQPPDPAELLLEQLLAEADAAQAATDTNSTQPQSEANRQLNNSPSNEPKS